MRFILIHGRTVKGKLGFSHGKYAPQRRPGGWHANPRSVIASLLFQFRFNSGIKTAERQRQGEVTRLLRSGGKSGKSDKAAARQWQKW